MKKGISYYNASLQSVFDGEPWYGKSLMTLIKETSPATIYKKASPQSHSAFEIIQHLLAWRDLLVKKLNGDYTSSIEGNSVQDWPPMPNQQNGEQWKILVDKLKSNQENLAKALSLQNEEALDKNFADSDVTLRQFLEGQLQHDIYHIGQVALSLKN